MVELLEHAGRNPLLTVITKAPRANPRRGVADPGPGRRPGRRAGPDGPPARTARRAGRAGQLTQGRPVLRPAAAARARLPGPPRGELLAGELPEPGQLGLQLAGFLLQLQDLADAGQVQPVGGQRADLGEPVDVPPGVAAGAACAARRVQQPFPLVDPQRLRVQPGQLRGYRDAEQPPVQVRPSRTHHGRLRSWARYRSASTASLMSSSSQPPARGAWRGPSTRTGPARSGGSGIRTSGVMPAGSATRRTGTRIRAAGTRLAGCRSRARARS